ncbi:deoxyribose-phosphate aldolase [Algoriella xinjiangensis]|uniref:Deoxyribose-phosphate aldolase n=1 Tax=Algoriella xinjiangensis TaxID=684065 RepID=A0A1I4U5S2_9FLAO|nr:deoxyribose-phosphate aldolase [Algoriella xinjiangensis]SFM84151.1 deoxyribose-phosphate aldolase [Algoriella xinjiangensis]VDH17854.1 Deoxyribose-phosphate aldolase [Algoriella xinjiangensis]
MSINQYLDSTYLKTPAQAGISNSDTLDMVHKLTQEAIDNEIYAVMIRPDYVRSVRALLEERKSNVVLGTVIGFHEGTNDLNEKLREAQRAIADGAEELDFVINYEAFKKGEIEKVKEEVETVTSIVLREAKVVKWIIETAALTDNQIVELTQLIRDIVINKLGEEYAPRVFVKSSTGFYRTPNDEPNGANEHVIKLMLANAGPLPVKASGGVRTAEEAEKMIALGVKRIGTSSALAIVKGEKATGDY